MSARSRGVGSRAGRWLLWGYLVLVSIVAAVALLPARPPARTCGAAPPASPRSFAAATSTPRCSPITCAPTYTSVPRGAVIFLGDSMVQGLATAAVAPLGVNYGIGGETTEGLLRRLPRYHSLARAAGIVIASGVNDLSIPDESTTEANIARILDALPPGVPVVLSAILPLDSAARAGYASGNARIERVNARLRALAAVRARVRFADVPGNMRAPDGRLLARLHDGDGLHLNAAGYAKWIAALRMACELAGIPVTPPSTSPAR
ncbi:MAG: GDSL-type esterase/lipase family protein [Burkholderiaceae bacterium]